MRLAIKLADEGAEFPLAKSVRVPTPTQFLIDFKTHFSLHLLRCIIPKSEEDHLK